MPSCIGRVSEEGVVELIHELTPIVDNSNLSNDQACESSGNRRRSENIHMGVHEACHQTKNDGRSYFQHGQNGVCSEEQDKKGYCCDWIKNVWSKSVEASFHMTIVSCVDANGVSVPPIFIIPGQQLNHSTMYQCSVIGSTATVAPKGFMNSNIFIKWLDHFSSNVPSYVKRHIFLVYNGYGSHYNTNIVEKSIGLRIIFVLLPYNSTHLIQTLEILVFKPFKTELNHQIEKFMIKNACTSFTKTDAIAI